MCYHGLWYQSNVNKLFRLYKALSANPASVLRSVLEPDCMNAAEDRVYQYLRTYIANMKEDEIRCFLRFVTGSAVLTSKRIAVTFNSLSGLQRWPIAHTCDSVLELSTSHSSYPKFEHNFAVLMLDKMLWTMDSI